MKKTALVALAVLAGMSMTSHARADELTYNSFLPAVEPVNSQGVEPFWKRVAERTGGEVTGKMFYAGQMLGLPEVLGGIRDGAVDSGFSVAGPSINEVPHMAVIENLMVYGTDPVVAQMAMMETYLLNCPQCQDEMAKNNVLTIGGTVTAPLQMVCSRDIKSAKELDGLRLMSVQRPEQVIAAKFGMTPVNIAFAEMIPSFQRGAVDCIFTMDAWFPAFGLADIVKSVISTRAFGVVPSPGLLSFSRDVWNGISDKNKQIMLDTAAETTAELAVFLRDTATQGRAFALDKGVKEADLGQEFLDRYAELVESERGNIEKVFADFGATDVGAIVDAYRASYAKWEKELPAGVDALTLAEKLKTEIYAKAKF